MHKVRARIMQILGIFIIYLFMLMAIVGTYQIVTRYFFNKPSTVSKKLLTYSPTWMALLASAYASGKRDHMRMEFLIDKISGSVKKYLEATIDLLILTFADVVITYGGISITKLTMIQTIAFPKVPTGYTHVITLVTGIIIMMFSLMNAADMLHIDSSKKEDAGV